jgi:hypothetical protein
MAGAGICIGELPARTILGVASAVLSRRSSTSIETAMAIYLSAKPASALVASGFADMFGDVFAEIGDHGDVPKP